MTVYAIINPVSGARNLARLIRHVRQRLEDEGIALACAVSRKPGDAVRLARQVPDDARAIVAVGGDGTVRDVVEARAGRPAPLLVLPTGTENIVAKALGMPPDPDAAIARILAGRPEPVDVGLVNGRRFLVIAGVGFDAEVVRRLHRVRDGHITHRDYFWPIWRTFWGHRFPVLRLTADGGEVYEGPGLAFVGVFRRYSLGLQILAEAQHDDGLLDLCVFPCASRSRLIAHSLRTLMCEHVRSSAVIYRKVRKLRIDSEVLVPLQVDGDVGGTTPAVFEVLPRAVQFLSNSAR